MDNPPKEKGSPPQKEPIKTASDRLLEQDIEDALRSFDKSEKKQTDTQVPIEQKKEERNQLPKTEEQEAAIRTYFSDVADVVQNKQISMTDIALAEQERRLEKKKEQPAQRAKKPLPLKSILITIFAIILIALGSGALYYTILALQSRTTQSINNTIENPDQYLVPIDFLETVVLKEEDKNRGFILNELERIQKGENREGLIGVTFVEPITNSEGDVEQEDISARDFLNILDVSVDAPFLRSVEDEFLVVLYKGDYSLITKTSFFENAFAGILRWEPLITTDLPFLVSPEVEHEVIATSTDFVSQLGDIIDDLAVQDGVAIEDVLEQIQEVASTTEAATSTEVVENVNDESQWIWKDVVIQNNDVRALFDVFDEKRILYSFTDKNTLIISSSEDALREVFKTLQSE